jgi:plastocyanin
MNITGSLVVCVTAAAFTATTLLINPDPSPAPAAAPVVAGVAAPEITISQFTFSGASVPAGATVTVNNLDGVEHTVTATDGSFDSGVVASATAVAFLAPNAPGTYSFVCAIHPSMSGQITVVA